MKKKYAPSYKAFEDLMAVLSNHSLIDDKNFCDRRLEADFMFKAFRKEVGENLVTVTNKESVHYYYKYLTTGFADLEFSYSEAVLTEKMEKFGLDITDFPDFEHPQLRKKLEKKPRDFFQEDDTFDPFSGLQTHKFFFTKYFEIIKDDAVEFLIDTFPEFQNSSDIRDQEIEEKNHRSRKVYIAGYEVTALRRMLLADKFGMHALLEGQIQFKKEIVEFWEGMTTNAKQNLKTYLSELEKPKSAWSAHFKREVAIVEKMYKYLIRAAAPSMVEDKK